MTTSKGEKVKRRERYGRRGDGREGKGIEGRAEERAGEGRGGEEKGGPHDTLAWAPQCLNPALLGLRDIPAGELTALPQLGSLAGFKLACF